MRIYLLIKKQFNYGAVGTEIKNTKREKKLLKKCRFFHVRKFRRKEKKH